MKKLLFASLLALGCVSANAQETTAKTAYEPNWYFQAQAGAQYTLGEISFGDLISPNIQLGIGRNFNSVFGLRLSVNAWQSKGGVKTWLELSNDANLKNFPLYKAADKQYDWSYKYVAPMLDATINLSNLFCKYNPKRVFNLSLLAGVGANIAFSNDDAQDVKADILAHHVSMGNENLDYLWDGTKVRLAGRIGLAADFRVSDRVSLGLEAQSNCVSDTYNSKRGPKADWYFNALAGVKVKLGKSKKAPVAEPIVPVVAPEPAPEVKPQPTPAPKVVEEKAPEVKKETIRRDVFFRIGTTGVTKAELAKVAEVAQFMKAHPDAKVTVTGYADVDTGTHAINARLAKNRAINVSNMLVNKYGISRSRIVTDSKGDTVAPYDTPVKCRVSICIAE